MHVGRSALPTFHKLTRVLPAAQGGGWEAPTLPCSHVPSPVQSFYKLTNVVLAAQGGGWEAPPAAMLTSPRPCSTQPVAALLFATLRGRAWLCQAMETGRECES